ncbi:lysophospholipase L1-like esterase [Rhodopirellula rubra]|uniref:Lysophospholipase L1-like esterase n=1 Tax=Aporhodopirellula rubra TaxID=980271 RepID=A0A7W5H643_9BACT|nr:SGNH/GDSL hydrolase family protein [Aporhodopirellula rubra]MBB3207054.1 lysophospholipase L1-like esterase [Aporhodopirellula rubra]
MKRKSCLGMLLVTFLAASCVAGDTHVRRDAVECAPRNGLPNFLAKVDAGKSVKIAYLGGSITAAPGWRVQSREWFQKQYPDAQFEEIHAAIGGTGSDLGVFRLQNDVLRHQPDMMFVEFAVNDGGTSPVQIHQAMEGIVRQTWKANPDIDICFVYTLTEAMLKDLAAGKMQQSASAMEELADHYQIPSIHFGVKVNELHEAGELVFKAPKPENIADVKPMVFSSDGVHPHVETGHRLYTETIARSWPAIRKASGQTEPHELVEPLREDNWEHAKQVPITERMLHGEWRKLDAADSLAKRFNKNFPEMYQAMKPDASLKFTLDGTAAAVFHLLGPDGCEVQIRVDDQAPSSRRSIDGYCTYHRMSKLSLASGLPLGVHRFEVTVTPTQLDKREILFESKRAYFDENPKRYEDHTWYIGSLLVIGDVVEDEVSE